MEGGGEEVSIKELASNLTAYKEQLEQKIAKRKKTHAFKSKARQEQLEVVQNKKQNAWQQFQTTKAKTKKGSLQEGRKRVYSNHQRIHLEKWV
ncbi:hypothetical protein EUTSA_v10005196mg [Eutrema salsugineum]|uniref:Uncharacterized protein n=1 Tax=Eutrema salsugineum TaxID=72664 RepID=V4K6B6_EUTSA|nr:hypothetical protein EUTSA_v10005196mg [Eutrema salsugineum]